MNHGPDIYVRSSHDRRRAVHDRRLEDGTFHGHVRRSGVERRKGK